MKRERERKGDEIEVNVLTWIGVYTPFTGKIVKYNEAESTKDIFIHGRGCGEAAILTLLMRLSMATLILCSMSLTRLLRGWRWRDPYLHGGGGGGSGRE